MTKPGTRATPREAGDGLRWSRVALGLAALVALVLLGRSAGDALPALTARVEAFGIWGPALFMLAYAAAVVAFVPASLLTLAAGAIFGISAGTAYVFVAATLGSAAAFLVSRYLARAAIEQKLAGNEKFASIDRAVGEQGRKIVFLLRLSPLFPFNLLNYALGLTRVRFVDYLVASLGMLPGTLLYVYSGKLAGDVAALAGGAAPERGLAHSLFLGFGLVATIAVTLVVTRIARRALAEATHGARAEVA
ncbi:MAG: TVP38/TMEM64 family protein [Myxococcales bacterium]|nr:TVP38/TMEM64 family protein [Myxococcales bacterium]MDH5305909.1 TVP38/TMEM64 family protein [Myxococcales bacterium]MDH5566890.1 TVP38/TMEM64 family protein [Myxococcales bacterium]